MTDEHRHAITLSAMEGCKNDQLLKKNSKSIRQLKSRGARAAAFDHLDAANLYPTSPFKGRNIVDFSRFRV